MKNVWQTVKGTWEYLNGKKTVIGIVLMLAAQGSQAFFPGLITPEQAAFLNTAGACIGGFGLAHKGLKTETVQQMLTKIKPKKK